MNNLHITFYQQYIAWGDPEANRRRVEEELGSIRRDTDIFVVPETFTTGFGNHMSALAETPDGPTLEWARRMAERHQLLFVGTWVVKEGERCYNRLHWVYPDGTHGHYDKAHTFRVSGESDQITRGSERAVFEYKGWRIKPAVCYDLRFPKWLRNEVRTEENGELQYDLLLVCANWPGSRHEAWTTLLKARAIENLCYVVGCNRIGTDQEGILYTGDSAAVNYKGIVVAEGDGEQCISATLNKDALATFQQHWPFYLDFD
ncbi:MAG: nitrilase family protein [Bacteroidales bacterium]|nr:nitrilase family protein [Bacteroidales bacterium]